MDFSCFYNPALNLLSNEDLKTRLMSDFKQYCEKAFAEEPTEWQGYKFVPGFETTTAKYAYEQWNPRKEDIIVASYPKTGTTWTRELCYQIEACKNKSIDDYTNVLNPFYSYLSCGPVSKYELLDKIPITRRIMGSHLPAPLFNFEKFRKSGTKVIYVIRNPKDQAVSWYYFSKKQLFANIEPWKSLYGQDKEDFFDDYLLGVNQPLFSREGDQVPCLQHIKSWWEHKDDENLLFLFFEDMKQDIQREVRKIADFIGVSLTDEEVASVAEKSSLEEMKNKNSEVQSRLQLTRTGKVGEWKNYLTEAQSNFIDKRVKEVLGGTGIEFTYEL